MVKFHSKMLESQLKSIDQFLDNSDIKPWRHSLNSTNPQDGFSALLAHDKYLELIKEQGYGTINDWLLDIESWSNKILSPGATHIKSSLLLYELWDSFKKSIIEALKSARLNSNIPNKGGVLVFIAGLSKCIVIEYYITGEYPKFTIVDIIDNPQSAFDFWGAISEANMTEKNILKEIISTGHKIIIHRGIIIHVDKRKDIQVFGPSIDTLLLAEIQSQLLYDSQLKIESALEIGCGNGLLSVSLAKYCHTLNKLFSIDINFNSIYCLKNNLSANISAFKLKQLNTFLTCGEFSENLFKNKFDFIVCNPPYIPIEESTQEINNQLADYYQAVGGTELIDTILKNLDDLLNPNGQLLLLVSNLSLQSTLDLIPSGFNVTNLIEDGHKVLFDVEAVLKKPNWLKFLIDKCGLICESEIYYHKIFPLLIKRN